jgi:hypothetical protein
MLFQPGTFQPGAPLVLTFFPVAFPDRAESCFWTGAEWSPLRNRAADLLLTIGFRSTSQPGVDGLIS